MDGRPSTPARPATPGGLRCGAGASTTADLPRAIAEAILAAERDLGPGDRADLAVVFVSKGHGHAIRGAMETLSETVPARVVIGSTAEGLVAGGVEHEDGPAVTVWLARMPGATIAPMALEYAQTSDGGSFIGWPADLDAGWPANASLLLLADPFTCPVDRLLKRVDEDHPGVVVVGGMASGGYEPGCNTLVVGPRTYDSGAVGVVIGGAVRVRPVVSQGCRPIGHPLVITRADANVIVELGGRPAIERLREIYSGLDHTDRTLVRTSLHLGRVANEYQDSFQRGDFLVRTVAGADPDSGVLAIGDLVRTGQTVQFHVRDAASAHDDLVALLTREKDQGARPAGALVFTCNGRGSRLFNTPSHDAACLQEILGPLPAAGFFAQGEIGPIGRQTFVHGFTASIALFEQA
ncbi:MAG: FIST N-terminal domain-containing protein [Planctomycetia bacterium]